MEIRAPAGFQLKTPRDPIVRPERCGGSVAGACPYFENALAAFQLQGLRHQGHDVRLRDGLPLLDRKGCVLASKLGQLLGQKDLSRNLSKSFQNVRIANIASRDLEPHHLLTQYLELLCIFP